MRTGIGRRECMVGPSVVTKDFVVMTHTTAFTTLIL